MDADKIIVIAVIVVTGLYFFVVLPVMAAEEEEATAKVEKAEKQLAEFQAQQKQEEQQRQERDKAVQASRAAAEAAAVAQKVMGFEQHLKNGIDPTQCYAERDQALRDAMFMQLARGAHLVVKYLGSPTGRIAIEWTVVDVRWEHPSVSLCYEDADGKECLLVRDVGVANRWGDHLHRGEKRRFRVTLRNKREELDRTEFLIHIPNIDQWLESVDPIVPPILPPPPLAIIESEEPIDPTAAMEKEIKASILQDLYIRKLRDEEYESIDKSTLMSEEQKEDAKARIDMAIAKARKKHQKE